MKNLFSLRKFYVSVLLITIFTSQLYGQNTAISDVPYTPVPSAMLDVYSTSKGMLVPRMLEAEKNAINSPATGLLVFQTDGAAGFYYYDGAAWVPFTTGDTGWLLDGNDVSAPRGLGTISNYDLPIITNNTEKMRVSNTGSVGIGTTSFDPVNPERLLVDYGTTTSNTIASFRGNLNNYLQINVQNTSDGTDASTDIVATANNGTDSTYYIDMGINSSNYLPSVDNFGGPNDGYLYTYSRHLVMGTAAPNSDIIFLVNGGQLNVNQAMRIDGSSKNIIIGRRDNSINPVGNIIRGPNGSGTNINGGSLTLLGGNATGTGTGGAVNLTGGSTGAGTGGAVNINVGTNNPANINTGANTQNVTIGNSSNNVIFPKFTTTGGLHYNTNSSGQLGAASLLIWDNTTNRLGINTATPGSTLDVKGALRLSGSTSGYVGLQPAAAAGSTTYTLPASDGTNGQALTTNGSGTLTWNALAGGSPAWGLSGNSGTTAGTNFLGTTDLKDLVFKTNAAEVMRATSSGNVGIGVTAPAEKLDVNGNIKATNIRTYGFTRSVPTVINDAVDIGSFAFTAGGGYLDISIVVPSSGFSVSKYYALAIKYSQTSNTWVTVTPTSNTGAYGGNDFDLDYNVNAGTTYLRIRRTSGSTVGTAYVTIKHQGVVSDVFTASTTVNTVTAPATTSNPPAPNINWAQTGNTGLSAATNFIGTTDAVDVITKSNNAEVMRATSSGNVGIGVTAPAEKLEVNGNIKATNIRTYGFTRSVPTTVGDAIDIGSFLFTFGGGYLDISIVVPSSGFSVSKYYTLAIKSNQTSNTWVAVTPNSNSGAYGTNDFDMDYKVSGSTTSLRIRRTSGTTAGTAYVTIKHQGVVSDVFTQSTTVNTVTAPATSYPSITDWGLAGNTGLSALTNFIGTTDAVDVVTKSNSTEVMRATSTGNVGIGVTAPNEKLEVNGNIKATNIHTYGLTRSVPTTVGDAVDIGSFLFTFGGGYLDISIVVPSSGFSVSKYYTMAIKSNQTSNTWVAVTPNSNSGAYGTNDFDMDYKVSGSTTSLRIRRTSGTTAGTAYVTIKQQGVASDVFTQSTTVNTVTAPVTSYPSITDWGVAGNTGLSALTNFIGTTDAVDVITKANNAEVMRATSSGNVGIGVTAPNEKLEVNGNIKATNIRTYGFTRSVPTVVNDAVDIGSFAFTLGGGYLDISIVVPSSGFSVSKYYSLAIKYSQTSGAWVTVTPNSNTGAFGSNDFDLDYNVSAATASLRIRRTSGATVGTAYITIKHQGVVSDVFTASTTVNTVTAPATSYPSVTTWGVAGNTGLSAATNYIGTTDAIDVVTKSNGTEVMRATSSGNVGIGVTVPSEKLEVNGNIKATNIRTYGFTRSVPTTVSDAVDIGSFVFTAGGGYLDISVVVPSSGFSVSKYYSLAIKYSQTSGAWVTVNPNSNTGAYGSNDFDLDYNVTASTASFRIRRTSGATVGTAYVTIRHQGVVSDVFTSSTTVNTVTAPVTSYPQVTTWGVAGNTGLSAATNYIGTIDAIDVVTKSNGAEVMRATTSGNVGIGVTAPNEKLEVNGNIKAANIRTYGFTRSVPTTVSDAVDIGSFVFTAGGGYVDISLVVPSSGFSVSKYYSLAIKYSQTGGAWVTVTPNSNTGAYGSNDFDLDYNVSASTASFRIRRTSGATVGTAYVTIRHQGVVSDAFTASTTVNTVTAPVTSYPQVTTWGVAGNGGLTAGTNYIGTSDAVDVVTKSNGTEVMRATTSGKIGIGVTAPTSTLQVNGSVAASVSSKNSSYTLTAFDYCVVFTGSTAAQTLTLPTASSSTGRIYVLANTATVAVSGSSIKVGSAAATTISIASGSNVQVISDGSNWIKIN